MSIKQLNAALKVIHDNGLRYEITFKGDIA